MTLRAPNHVEACGPHAHAARVAGVVWPYHLLRPGGQVSLTVLATSALSITLLAVTVVVPLL